MATVYSYKQICTLLEDIATRHPNINTFKEGESSDFGEDGSILYPAMKVNIVPEQSSMPVNDYAEYPSLILAVNIQMLDQLLPAEENRIDTKSDMLHLMQDVINELTSHPYYMRSNVKLLNDIKFEKYYRVSDDNNSGIGAILYFQLVNDNAWCGLPFEDIAGFSANGPVSTGYSQSTSFLKCSTLTGCSQFVDYIQTAIDGVVTDNFYTTGATLIGTEAVFDRNDQLSAYTLQLSGLTSGLTSDNFYTTGGTLIGTTIHFDRNDLLDAYEIQLSGLTSGITATGAYLNLSGGTVTGATTFQSGLTSNKFYVSGYDAVNPGISNAIDANTGFMFDGPDVISIHTGGIQRLLINAVGQITNGSHLAGTGIETYLSGETKVDTLSAATAWVYNDPWTIELINGTTVDFYAPYAMAINSSTNILGSPVISLKDDDVAYTTGTTIAIGSKISVSGSTTGVTILNAIRL